MIGACIVLMVLVVAAFYALQAGDRINVSSIHAVAALRTRQFVAWLGEQDAQADLVRSTSIFSDAYRRWRQTGDPAARDHLLGQLFEYGQHTGFSDVILWDLKADRAWSATGRSPGLAPELRLTARQALETAKLVRYGPYRQDGGALLDFIVPVPDSTDQTLIVMRMDPSEQMAIALMRWALPEIPDEVQLLRRDGDAVVALGLAGPGTAAIQRIPLASSERLCIRVFADSSRQGELLDGLDGAGVAVMGVALPIPGTDWLLMTKIDREDVAANAFLHIPWPLISGLLALVGLVVLFRCMQQGETLGASRREREAQTERLRALDMLNAIAETSGEGIFARDLDGRYLLFNPVLCNLLNKTPEEVLGQDYRALYPAPMVAQLEDMDRRILAENGIFTQEELIDTAQGQRVILMTRGPLHDNAGRIIGIFGIARDFASHLRMEAGLQERSALRGTLDSIVESAPGALHSLLIRPDGVCCIPFSTPMIEDLYGLSRQELARDLETLKSRIHSEDLARLEQVLRKPQQGSRRLREVFRYRHPARGWCWIEGWATPKQESDGSLLWHGFFMDVTDRVEGEEALRESEERYRLLFERSSDALLVLEPNDWKIVRANPAAVSMFQAADEPHLVSRSFWDYSPPEQEGGLPSTVRAIELMNMALRFGACVFDWQYRRLDGEVFPATVRTTRFDLLGKPVIQCSIRDVTHRKRQEQELIRSRAKLRELTAHREKAREDERAYMAREIHDDLGQYLTALRMETNLMGMLLAEQNGEAVKRLVSMKELIDHLIAETRRVIARLRPVALDLGLVSAAEWLAADYRERMGVDCHLEVGDADELELDDDQATTLFRILQECLTNVIRHAHASRVDIRVSVSGEVLCMEVHDDGQGFDPAQVRAKKTFGLMGIRERVLIYGGSARIDSQIGEGTRLTINMPIKRRGDA
ncbi:PAS domain-containing sensor histidine kinase [Thiorhodococcus fuscus]|uniref:PAS domain S-box protein n=1 Tax=Thiorhodococcus fuscus TaxID=527200 RepID=A0ABW4Y5L6_9GAMM